MEGLFIAAGVFVGLPMVLGSIARSHWAHQRYMKALMLKAEANTRLIDRLGSDPAALELLKADAQSTLFDFSMPEPAASPSLPYTRMLTALQAGLLLLSAGSACLWFGNRQFPDFRESEAFVFFGVMGIALGAGSLLSAMAALVVGRLWQKLHGTTQTSVTTARPTA